MICRDQQHYHDNHHQFVLDPLSHACDEDAARAKKRPCRPSSFTGTARPSLRQSTRASPRTVRFAAISSDVIEFNEIRNRSTYSELRAGLVAPGGSSGAIATTPLRQSFLATSTDVRGRLAPRRRP